MSDTALVPPTVRVGWLLAADLGGSAMRERYEQARLRLLDRLQSEIPELSWELCPAERRIHPPRGALDPLSLLELGGEEKLHRGWHAALVVVPNELIPRHRITTLGVPSSALEVGVLSSARLGEGDALVDRLVALALHVLGHVWGLEHRDAGPMRPPEDPEALVLEPFSPEERAELEARLRAITHVRLEQQRRRWGPLGFYLRTLFRDLRSILHDVWGYRPWRMPLFLGRLTAAAAVTSVFLLLSSDAWALGAHLDPRQLWGGAAVAVLVAVLFVFLGQDVGAQGRVAGWSEQLARTRIVLFGTLLVGMVSLWAALLAISALAALGLPREVVEAWAGVPPERLSLVRYAGFMATLGILGAALGGNLEEEGEIKAQLLFDEET